MTDKDLCVNCKLDSKTCGYKDYDMKVIMCIGFIKK